MHPRHGRKIRRAAAFTATALVAAALMIAPAAATHSGPGECPQILESSQVTEGMSGTGYTVSSGNTPESFTAEVLGVLPDGIAPGRDMILIEASSPAIDKAGGVWFGMSGSPVYVGGKLIGAVAFGLGFGPSKIAGLTAAQDLVALADRPAASPPEIPRKVRLSERTVRTIARATGRSASDTPESMRLLKSPLSVSGIGSRGLGLVTEAVNREKLGLVPYSGTSATAAPDPSATAPEQGGNFAAAFSYGDITSAGIGTTSYVCNDKVVAFGHSMFFFPAGKVALGANSADAIAIIDDSLFGPFKVANIGATYGVLDQDRFAGVRALLGTTFPTIPISSDIETEDGLSQRNGQTDVVDPDFTPFAAFIHMLANMDVVRDEIGAGASQVGWTIDGTREDGSPWSLSRSNLYSSDFDIAYESLFELERQISQLLFNEFEEVKVTGIDVESTVGTEPRELQISQVLVSKDGEEYRERSSIKAFPGQTLSIRVVLTPNDGGPDINDDFEVLVPAGTRRDHFLRISGGPTRGGSFGDFDQVCFEGSLCRHKSVKKVSSFDDLLAKLEGTPHNNDLVSVLKGIRGKTKSQQIQTLDRVVRGRFSLYIRVRGSEDGAVEFGSTKS